MAAAASTSPEPHRDSAPADLSIALDVACPAGHPLLAKAARAGTCDKCGKGVQEGECVADCRRCDWYACTRCTIALRRSPAAAGDGVATPSGSSLACLSGHALAPWTATSRGACDGCQRTVWAGNPLMDCRECDWHCGGSVFRLLLPAATRAGRACVLPARSRATALGLPAGGRVRLLWRHAAGRHDGLGLQAVRLVRVRGGGRRVLLEGRPVGRRA
ncbi:unnamed protein product [Prorocentrum cordatum]|uniref:Uncharacterized protein n=1 Tax=Prorocentrum cordatum TaxID=2364126 RepID=A0ABN9TU94_9DINO|nr:unnamed protein product [Polarella glacialis]